MKGLSFYNYLNEMNLSEALTGLDLFIFALKRVRVKKM